METGTEALKMGTVLLSHWIICFVQCTGVQGACASLLKHCEWSSEHYQKHRSSESTAGTQSCPKTLTFSQLEDGIQVFHYLLTDLYRLHCSM